MWSDARESDQCLTKVMVGAGGIDGEWCEHTTLPKRAAIY